MASPGKLALMLRLNKSSDTGTEPCGSVASLLHTKLCYNPVLHRHSEQAALSWYCNHSLAAMVKITVSKVFLPDFHQNVSVFLPLAGNLSHGLSVVEKELVNSLKPGGTCWSLERRGKRIHEKAGGSEVHSASRWRGAGCGLQSKGMGRYRIALVCLSLVSFIHSYVAATVTCPGKMQWTQMDLVDRGCICFTR